MIRLLTIAAMLGIAVIVAAAQETRPVTVYVFTDQHDGKLIPFNQKDLNESVKHFRKELADRLPKKTAAIATDAAGADVVVEVLDRKADGDDIAVNLKVSVGAESWNIEGVNDDGHWSDAAIDGTKKIVEWLKLNDGRIQSRAK